MAVKRIVSNMAVETISEVQRFYVELFDLKVVMDHSLIVTLASDETAKLQIGIMTECGSGAPVPDASIEVDDVDSVYERSLNLGHDITYPLTDELWGVRLNFVHDPTGKILNVLSHAA